MKLEQKIGAWFEHQVEEVLKEIQATRPAMWHRFTDSKAAQNLVKAQPGDHMLIMRGVPFLIEEKCSLKHNSLRSGFSSLWSKKQASKHLLWRRAGAPSMVIFCNYASDVPEDLMGVDIWDGGVLAKIRCSGRQIPKTVNPWGACRVETLETNLYAIMKRIGSRYNNAHF